MEARIERRREKEETPKRMTSLSRSISPPLSKRHKTTQSFTSPFQLTWIRDLGRGDNRDAVTLAHLLGDPLMSECWNFNYLHDIHFLMEAFHEDVRSHVQFHVVHGFWKKEDANRLQLIEDASCFRNVQLHVAPMPVMFGTHHSKMLVIFRRNKTAQVIIHTANMISKDWTNMTNAVWKSPWLPKQHVIKEHIEPQDMKLGSGERFKHDLLNYLKAYDRMRPVCTSLTKKLKEYDFSQVQGSLIASTPGTHEIHQEPDGTHFGWKGLEKALEQVPCGKEQGEVVIQVSSIATLGGSDTWLRGTLFKALSKQQGAELGSPKFKVVFPTAREIRRSLDGYGSGGSIHTKIQSRQQDMQLRYLRPMLHHWAADAGSRISKETRDAGRDRAAPHVKTYIRYGAKQTIDWALLTSANLSKQAWGEATKGRGGEFRISSWEIGVLVWPSLIKEGAVMVASFKSDRASEGEVVGERSSVVGLRVPYSLPLERYGENETPWVATLEHKEADCLGQTWIQRP